METSTLVLDNLVKAFGRRGEVRAVDGLSLKICRGEFVTLLGPSGCGKTTTLRIIAGFEFPTAGRILLDGKTINNVPPNKRPMALVFQSYALFPHMSVYENISYGLKVKKQPQALIRESVEIVMQLMNLVGVGDRMPHQLSGGQQQRVALARALVMQPKVLLFDEPLSNLDAKLRLQMRLEIRRLQQRLGITTVYVTHDQTEAMSLSDRIAVMHDGRIEQIGTPSEIYEQPASLFVADFIGSPSMNFFDAKISRSGSTLFVDAGAFVVPIPSDKAQRFSSRVGKEIIFGLRPEHIHDPKFAPPGITTAYVETRVDVTEPMGNEVFLHLVTGAHFFIARVDPRTSARMGDRLEVSFDMSQIHIFERDSQVAVC